MTKKTIECPICHKMFGSLNMHIVYTHHMTIEEFRKQYPNQRLQQLTEKGLVACTCPICGKVIINIKQHIELAHKIQWDDFVNQYKWTGMKKYYSEKAKHNSSINKKQFYASERGEALKKIQSIKMSGTNNVVYLPGVREKLVNSANERGLSRNTGYGISIWLNDGTHLKSFNEFMAYLIFKENNINFEYEKLKIKYLQDNQWHIYFADFVVGNCIYELKNYTRVKINNWSFKKANKYMKIKEYAEKAGYTFKVVSCLTLVDELGLPSIGEPNLKKEMKDNLYKYLIENKITKILINKGIKPDEFKTFLEKEDRWKQFNNIIEITHKEKSNEVAKS